MKSQSKFTIKFSSFLLVSILLSIVSSPFIECDVLDEPEGNQIYFGAWLDSRDTALGANDGDRPQLFNDRMNFEATVFQYAQNLPVATTPAPFNQVFETNTNAILLLTVYTDPDPFNIQDADIKALVDQLAELTNFYNRKVMVRLSPEMNGNWNIYGQQPSQYVAMWIRVATAIRAGASDVKLLWAPSSGNGYPYGGTGPAPGSPDFTLLDTNSDGAFNELDNPYSPYYPGDEWVDWVGMSVYHYGITFPWLDNSIAEPGKFVSILNAQDFYNIYSSAPHNKPIAVAEGGAAYHRDTPRLAEGESEVDTKQSFWRQWITNETFFAEHPRFKMVNLFEWEKIEETTLRDFRVSTDETVRNAFLADFETVRGRYVQADPSGASSVGFSALLGLVVLICVFY